ncbi:O-antigen ligase family protein [uncultured Maribacter sp.]|uniref:O-antigen ligase family protein n=1 Tax=uncultured Maribacter sp. TaxID=431308 RepID=UPI00260A51F1|nr:O-antigen ligase family protein [uncultured Maribacter sp.]
MVAIRMTWITFLQATKKTLIFLIFIVLLIGLPQVNLVDYPQSTITSKFIIFSYGCLTILSISLLLILLKKRAIHISKIDILLLFFLGYIILNRYLIQSDFGFSIRYFELIGLGILYVVLRNLSFKEFTWLLVAVIISGIIQTSYGNLQLLGYYASNHSGFALTGSFFNPGPYAGFLTAVWCIALGMYLFKEKIVTHIQIKNKTKINKFITFFFKYISFIGIVSIVLVLPATRSRAAWLGVLASSVVLIEYRYSFFINFLKNSKKIKKIIFLVVSIIITGSLLIGAYYFKKGSSDGRLFIWKVATSMIKENPFFGVGFDRFKAHYMNYQSGYFAQQGKTMETLVADNTYYGFNDFLQFMTENGFFGIVFFLFLLYFFIKIKVKKEHYFVLIILNSSLLAIGCFAFFSYPMQIIPIKLILVLIIAFLSTLDVNKYIFLKDFKALKRFKVVIFSIGVISLYQTIPYVITLDQNFKIWKSALNSYQYGNYESAIEEYAKVYPELKKNGDFLMNYGKALSMNNQNTEAIRILEEAKLYLNTTIIETALGDSYKRIKQYDKAEMAYKTAANMIPVRFYPMYLLAKLYEESGETVKAMTIANKILNKDIKIPSTAIKEIQAEMKMILQRSEKLIK